LGGPIGKRGGIRPSAVVGRRACPLKRFAAPSEEPTLVSHSRLSCLTALLLALSLAGCSVFEPKDQIRGNKVDDDQIKELTVGTSTRADVTALLRSPTLHASFDDNTWLYISEITRPRIGGTQGIESQRVVALAFDEKGVLRAVKTTNQDDAVPVSMVDRKTPSPGSEASFLQQLFGNIGRFSAAGVGGNASAPSGGAPKPF
jgi:outer membrane protein assembly factor BamE (lipoprotein component of BamABCDE complex)